nr:asparagine synthase (glutamine-hydrolyzing) [Gemmatimonadota bacterium]
MCGIAGVVSLGAEPASEAAALAMAERIRHRGPDRRSSYLAPSGRCAFGHARLSIIDLETGDQPMGNEDGTVQVIFNGEIYNFQELRRELEGLGHRFRTRSDTEAIVHGYEAWGEGLAERLDGMFAFAVWDERRRRLLVARDRAGKKPLYVARDERKLVFGSEIKAVLAHPGMDDELDPRAIPLYLVYGYVPTPGTFYRSVRSLPPACCLAVEANGSVRQWSYWELDFRARRIGKGEAAERLRELVRTAVARRLIADVPLGAFLSGGIDSTLVVGLMSELADEPVRTFSIGYADDPHYDETGYARLAADRFGARHTEFIVGPQSIDLVDRLVAAYDEPFGDSSAIPTYLVSELTRRHVTVALNGDGGDEMFAGYLRFYGAIIAERMPRWLVRLGDVVGRRLPYDPDFRSSSRRFSRFFRAAALSMEDRMLRWIGFFADQVESLLKPEARAACTADELTASFREPLARAAALSPLARALFLNFRTYLPDDLLVKADRCSMAHGLELRSPLLDTAVMEFAASLPDRLRLRNGRTKFLLRYAFRELFPERIRRRGKMGFGIPLPTWFRREWRRLVEERLLSGDAKIYRWLEREPVRRIANAHFAAEADYGHQLWALLTLETWLAGR